jgi:hypothetical protein
MDDDRYVCLGLLVSLALMRCDGNVVVMDLASDLGPWFPQGDAAP